MRVAIIQRSIPHYRDRFFEEVCDQARLIGLHVTVFCGEAARSASSYRFPLRVLPMRNIPPAALGAVWMRGLAEALHDSQVVVAPQELRCLNVPLLWAGRQRRFRTWIWWAHHSRSLRHDRLLDWAKDSLKHFMTKRAMGIITYAERGAAYWRQEGIDASRVFPYFNTIDVEGLRDVATGIAPDMLREVRRRLQLDGKRVVLFSGRLYPEKRLDFLLRSLAATPTPSAPVALLVLGDGRERARLETLTLRLGLSDVHFLGEIVDPQATAAYFLVADLLVIPGLVGLALVHGFAHGVPVVTTPQDAHGPEIEYLSPCNGVIARSDESTFGAELRALLSDQSRLTAMRHAATETGDHLLLSHSAGRFVRAIAELSHRESENDAS